MFKKLLKIAQLYIIAVESLNMNFTLTDIEEKIFSLLRNVVKDKAPNTTLRVAGGWVRDKLMGKDSNDIDIAIDNMTGEDFAKLTKEWMEEHNLQTKDIAIVEANPDQSKHLATAMVKIFGLPIDFVNLRTEVYSDSRIPEMAFGSPEEDAERRDLTINALFYNVNNGKLEDHVGGLQDLKSGIARTPMDPVKTFLDDPLRIMRTVRFAARYNLELAPELIEAAHNPQVREAFKNKLSQERIWQELAGKKEGDKWKPGALIGPDPTKAAQLLKQLGLMEAVFDPTTDEMKAMNLEHEMVPWDTDQDNPHHSFNIWDHTLNVVKNLVEQTKQDIKDDHETYLVRNLAALLHDISKRYKGLQDRSKGHTSYHGHEATSSQMAEKVLTRLRAPKHIVKRVVNLIQAHLRPHMMQGGQGGPKAKRRYVKDLGEDWKHSIDLAIADNLGKKDFSDEERLSEIQRYEDMRSGMQELMQGQTSTTIKRPINGKDLIDIGIPPGPVMGQIMKALDDLLLENPNLTREEALNLAREMS